MNPITHIDLFAGIGGFAYALRLAGIPVEKTYFSETDDYASRVYQKNFPDAIALGDITKINWQELKNETTGKLLITGGFPCQDISIAGKGGGIRAERSGLWFEMQKAVGIHSEIPAIAPGFFLHFFFAKVKLFPVTFRNIQRYE